MAPTGTCSYVFAGLFDFYLPPPSGSKLHEGRDHVSFSSTYLNAWQIVNEPISVTEWMILTPFFIHWVQGLSGQGDHRTKWDQIHKLQNWSWVFGTSGFPHADWDSLGCISKEARSQGSPSPSLISALGLWSNLGWETSLNFSFPSCEVGIRPTFEGCKSQMRRCIFKVPGVKIDVYPHLASWSLALFAHCKVKN